jgi:hypothetical protein
LINLKTIIMKKLLFIIGLISVSLVGFGQSWDHYYGKLPQDSILGLDTLQFLVIDAEDDSTFWVSADQLNTLWVRLTEEQVEDYIGGMVTGNTETNITVTYQDADGTIDFVVSAAAGTVAVADSSGVAAGSYVTGWDFVAGQALKVNLADSSGVAAGSYMTGFDGAALPTFAEMRGEISDSLDAFVSDGETGIALADSSGVAAGSYFTGFDAAALTATVATKLSITDTVLIYSFGAGGGLAGDTALFLTTLDQVHGHVKIYEDSLQLGKIETYISSGDTLRFSLVYGDTIFDADGTLVTIAADEGVTNTTSFSISTLRERNYIWIDVLSVVAGKKPIVFRCDLYGYIKRN